MTGLIGQLSRRRVLSASIGLAAITLPGKALAQEATPGATPAAATPPQAFLATDIAWAEGQTAEVNGISLYYETYGDGDPVFLLHGGLGNGTYWANQIPTFADHFKLIVVDSRGHGRSTFDDQQITYELMASDVLALADALGIEAFTIVGWSDGGNIGLDIAINNPDRLTRVVTYGANADLSGLNPDVGTSDTFNAYIEAAAADYQKLSPAPERWDEFLNNISTMWATLPNYTAEQLGAITTPFLVLDGWREEAILPAHAFYLADTIPGAELAIMPNIGHFAMFEQPEEFNGIVLTYLLA
jgi:pimeloyl-ACP methyl ester carboxylesterase